MENNTQNNTLALSKLIGESVVFYPNSVAKMLNINGVTIDAETYNTEKLIDAVVDGLSKSPKFANDFLKTFNVKENYLNAVGDWITGGTAVIGGITTFLGGKQQEDAIKAQAKAQADVSKAQLEIAKINQQTELAKLGALKDGGAVAGKSNTGLYIGLGVGGVLVLGLVVYLAVKK
jgi:hypothetical protein